MLTVPLAISSQASNSSWAQRRLPGHSVDGHLTRDARLLEREVAGRERVVVRLDQRLADVVVGRRPDLAVGVHLRAPDADPCLVAREVVADVRVVERAHVHAVVADPRHLVAGHVRADGERVLVAERDECLRVEELGSGEVGPALAHAAGLVAREACVGAGDHAVRDQVPVLVRDHRHVVVAVDARPIEARRDRAARGTCSSPARSRRTVRTGSRCRATGTRAARRRCRRPERSRAPGRSPPRRGRS